MNNNYVFIILLILIILIILILINNNFKENFICINPKTYDNKVCKSNFKNDSILISQNYCNNNNNCNGYISFDFKDIFNNKNTIYFKCRDNWSGELYQKDLIYNKLKDIYKDYDFSNLKTYKCNNNCPPGKGIIDDSNTCLDCPDNKYNAGDSNNCKEIAKCPSNYSLINYDKKTGNISCEINAKPGFYYDLNTSTIKPCPKGQYQNSTGQTSCKQCPAGQYQNSTGQGGCNKCPEGHYQNSTGQTGCKICPAGKYQYLTGQSSCSGPCYTGYYSTRGSSWCSKITEVTTCPDNKYRLLGNSTRNGSCAYIPSGHERIEGTLDIRRCPAGKVSPGGAYHWYAGCQLCDDGFWQDLPGQSYCYSTPPGYETYPDRTGYDYWGGKAKGL